MIADLDVGRDLEILIRGASQALTFVWCKSIAGDFGDFMTNTVSKPSLKKDAHRREKIVASLDIGTSKVAVIMAIARPEGLDIVGMGQAPTAGVRNGMIVNIEATTESIRKAKEEAELMSGYTLDTVWVSVSSSLTQSFDSKGMVAIKSKEVTQDDVLRVLEAAKTVNVPHDREVLHVLPREYVIDQQVGIHDPIGMSGVRLEAQVHIVTGQRSALQNLEKCAERAQLRVKGFVLQLASSMAILSDDEKKLGVALVDMGAGTSDIICYVQSSVAYTAVLGVGGQHFTQDISVGLRTPQACAEEIKKKFGCAFSEIPQSLDEVIEVEGVGGRQSRQVPRKYLSEVIEPRAEETLFLIRNKIDQSRLTPLLGSGVVLTGGAALMQGFAEMAEYIFEVPVRVGLPDKITGLKEVVKSPSMATAVGVLLYAQEIDKQHNTGKSLESGKGLFEDVSQK